MSEKNPAVTVRCPFCAKLNQVDMARAVDRPQCGSCSRPMHFDRPLRIEEADFSRTVLDAGVPVLVDFYADWCAPCRMVAPLMDEIAAERLGRLLVVKIDTDRAQKVAQTYGIQSIPTVIRFENGAEVARCVGFDAARIRALAAS